MSIYSQKCYVASSLCEILAGAQHCAVFDGACDHMLATRLKLQRRIDYRIVRFCSAAGENNFRRLTPEQRRQPFAGKIDSFSGLGRKAVPTRRITVIRGQERQHLLEHSGIELRGSIVIKVNDFVFGHHPPL